MTKSKKALLARDRKRNVGEELLQAVREVRRGRYGAKYTVANERDVPKPRGER